ncbi:hypothetical protein C8R44DRAFT_786524 [Mycena epipterygia]|nr:hypothetical protein C8R44DRAFT_786524 [Mycena epipterygia]
MSAILISPGPELESLFKLAIDAQTTSFMAVAFFILLIFDHLITLDQEVELIWKSPKPTLARYIYIWNRYFSLLVVGVSASVYLQHVDSDDLCQLYGRIRSLTSTVIVITVDSVLMLRVWALFGQSRKLMFFLVPLIIVEATVMIIIGELTVRALGHNIHVNLITGCYSTEALPSYFVFFAVPSLVVGLIMFALTVYNCNTKLEIPFSHAFNVKDSWMPLCTLFLRDGVFWFLAVIAVNPVQIFLWLTVPVTLTEVLMVPSMAVYSIIGSRVLLNMMELLNADVVGIPRYSNPRPGSTWQVPLRHQ